MCALSGQVPMIQHVNIVRFRDVGQAMGNQNDRLAPGQTMDARHDIVLALYVDIGRGFVKYIDGAVMQQGAGQRQTLPLAAGQVAAALGQLGVQAILAAQEICEVDLFQRAPQCAVVSVGCGHPQVVCHRTLEQVAAQADEGHVFQKVCFVDGGKLLPADGYAAGVASCAAGQYSSNRRFAAAALAHQRRKAALGKVEIQAVQRLFFGGVAKVQVTAGNGAVRADLGGPGIAFRQIQQLKNFIAGGHAVHGDVEIRPQRAHGQEEIRRQQQNAERTLQTHAAGGKLFSRHGNAQRRAAVGDDVHNDDGVQLHRQDFHRHLAEMLGLAVHGRMAGFVCLVDFECGQPLKVFQKAVTQRGVLAPVFAQQFFGKFLHSHDGNRNQRHADHQNDRCPQADQGQRDKQCEGREHGVEKLRKVRAEVGLELFDALARQLQDLGGGHGLGVAASQAQQFFIDGGAQRLFHGAAGVVAGRSRAPGAEEPHDERTQQHKQRSGQTALAVHKPR